MSTIQCPVCKNEFDIDLDISITTKGFTVFRGRMAFLGKLRSVDQLFEYIKAIFRSKKRVETEELVQALVADCNIPTLDARYFVDKLKEEGFVYEPRRDLLELVGL